MEELLNVEHSELVDASNDTDIGVWIGVYKFMDDWYFYRAPHLANESFWMPGEPQYPCGAIDRMTLRWYTRPCLEQQWVMCQINEGAGGNPMESTGASEATTIDAETEEMNYTTTIDAETEEMNYMTTIDAETEEMNYTTTTRLQTETASSETTFTNTTNSAENFLLGEQSTGLNEKRTVSATVSSTPESISSDLVTDETSTDVTNEVHLKTTLARDISSGNVPSTSSTKILEKTTLCNKLSSTPLPNMRMQPFDNTYEDRIQDFVRKRETQSADDLRPSAVAMGVTGMSIIGIILFALILMDLDKFRKDLTKMKENIQSFMIQY